MKLPEPRCLKAVDQIAAMRLHVYCLVSHKQKAIYLYNPFPGIRVFSKFIPHSAVNIASKNLVSDCFEYCLGFMTRTHDLWSPRTKSTVVRVLNYASHYEDICRSGGI